LAHSEEHISDPPVLDRSHGHDRPRPFLVGRKVGVDDRELSDRVASQLQPRSTSSDLNRVPLGELTDLIKSGMDVTTSFLRFAAGEAGHEPHALLDIPT